MITKELVALFNGRVKDKKTDKREFPFFVEII
jgi:hypothetical protein